MTKDEILAELCSLRDRAKFDAMDMQVRAYSLSYFIINDMTKKKPEEIVLYQKSYSYEYGIAQDCMKRYLALDAAIKAIEKHG